MKINEEAKAIILEFYKKAMENIKIKTPSKECSCGGTFIKREGKYGIFYGCDNFPKCKETKKEMELMPYVQRASVQWINDCRMALSNLGITTTRAEVINIIKEKKLPCLMDIEEEMKSNLQNEKD